MRYDGIQSAGHKFDYNPTKIDKKEDDPLGNAVKFASNAVNNIGNFLTSGQGTLFQLRTSDAVPTENIEWDDYDKNRAARTGYVRAMINVYGFLK